MVSRRNMLKGIAALPLARILADPRLARAAAESLQDVSIKTAGGAEVRGALAVPANTPAGTVLVIHEWWGLNDQIKSVAAELGRQGYIALAADLYEGKLAEDPDNARKYMQAVDQQRATETVAAWAKWLRAHPQSNGKVGSVGFCFGGGWSLNASLAAPVDATVIYYGNVKKTAADLGTLQGPVLGHFATEDEWINKEMVGGFEQALKEAGKSYTHHWYDAQHAFANPTNARYDSEDAALAWNRTLGFFKAHLS